MNDSPMNPEATKGLLTVIKRFLGEPMPKGVNWLQTFGSSLLALILVQIVTGILLALYYSPNAGAAYDSVKYIETHVIFGHVIRGMHYFAASAMMILLLIHGARTFFYGAYKRPRQWTWVFGVVLLVLVVGFAFTGYLLPWDMKAYFATKVGINIAKMTPVIGAYLVSILQGGAEMGTITLSRFYALHVIVLPLSLILIVGLHLFYIRLHGPTPSALSTDRPVEYVNRFYPMQLYRDSLVAFVVIGTVVLLAIEYGAPLEQRADPTSTSYVPRPDWYFYALFQLLKFFEGRFEIVGAILLPGAFFTLLLLLPFIDRNPARDLIKRPLASGLGATAVTGVVLLTVMGAVTGEKARSKSEDTVTVEGEVEEIFVVDPSIGRQLYEGLKCGECHSQTSGDRNLPPGLEFSGNKYQQPWLVHYLQNPHRIRWQRKNQRPIARMPDFNLTEREALNLSAYLLTLTQDENFPQPEFDWAEADSEMVLSGEELAAEYGCLGCHKVGEDGQNIGPDLSHAGSKLLESYLFRIVQAPEKVIPGTAMKNFHLDVEEVEDIVAFLRMQK